MFLDLCTLGSVYVTRSVGKCKTRIVAQLECIYILLLVFIMHSVTSFLDFKMLTFKKFSNSGQSRAKGGECSPPERNPD